MGQVVDGRFRIDGRLDAGGMGIVFRATQLSVNRTVALKVLRGELSSQTGSVQRFTREATSVSRLSHPNIVTLLDFGQTEAGLLYLAMELIDGVLLTQRIRKEGRLPVRDAISITSQILEALEHAHANGIVHRDLKPSNVMLISLGSRRNFVKLLDFGVAKMFDEFAPDAMMTGTGFLVGTPAYMSPEQAVGDTVDGRSDLYSAGLILYEMLTGSRAFDADTTKSILLKRVREEPAPIDAKIRQQTPEAVLATLKRALARDPDKRFQSAREMRFAVDGEASVDASSGGGAADATATSLTPNLANDGSPGRDLTLARGEVVRRFDSRKVWITVTALLAVGLGVGLAIGFRDSGNGAVRVEAPAPATAEDFNAKTPSRKDARYETSSLGASAPLRQIPVPTPSPVPAPARRASVEVRPAARSLRPLVATLRVRVRCKDTNSLCWGAISLDGGDPETTRSATFRARHGTHTIVVQRDGYRPVEKKVKVSRDVENVTIELSRIP
ncbi:MAG: serine/threonine protein kinase [Deltaproteobacteria bacterium]|nr:serine/threonine protein kinase [Deltaproteobacteria bacterium]